MQKASSGRKRASISDVSRHAGVSTATVSRVLNDPERVAEKTRTRVLEAIEALNFVKSAAGFSLKSQKTMNILVVAENVGNIFYSEIFESLQHHAEEHGYSIVITAPARKGAPDHVMERLRTGRVDGVILLHGYAVSDADYDLLLDLYHGTPPIVGFAEKPGILRCPHIYIDNRTAARRATQHLIDHGHKRIAHLMGPQDAPVTEERIAGFREAMQAAGLEVRDSDLIPCGFLREAGRVGARQMLAQPDRFTAAFCASDEVAMGCMSELFAHGIRVPDDISVIGFDDIALADCYAPPLTTVMQPRPLIGKTAIDLLLDVIADPQGNTGRVVELDTELIVRNSVKTLAKSPGQSVAV